MEALKISVRVRRLKGYEEESGGQVVRGCSGEAPGCIWRPRRRQVSNGGPGGVRFQMAAHVCQVVSGGPGGV